MSVCGCEWNYLIMIAACCECLCIGELLVRLPEWMMFLLTGDGEYHSPEKCSPGDFYFCVSIASFNYQYTFFKVYCNFRNTYIYIFTTRSVAVFKPHQYSHIMWQAFKPHQYSHVMWHVQCKYDNSDEIIKKLFELSVWNACTFKMTYLEKKTLLYSYKKKTNISTCIKFSLFILDRINYQTPKPEL